MKKLMLSVLAASCLFGGAGLAMADEESQAGSAWRNTPNYGPVPGTPEYYGNSGWPPPGTVVVPQQAPYGYGYPGYGNRAYPPQYGATPAYPYHRQQRQLNPTRRDRDGDGVANRTDRYPDDPSRW